MFKFSYDTMEGGNTSDRMHGVASSCTIEQQIERLSEDIREMSVYASKEPRQTGSASSVSQDTLEEVPSLDKIFKSQLLKARQRNRKIQEARKRLPIYEKMEEILRLISENPVVLITGETGCGKTTQIPQYILDDYIERGKGSVCRIICTQPRKVSTVSVAERVAKERGEPCGKNQSTGYQIRLDNNLPRHTGSIVYCTSGIMLKLLQNDPYLSSCSHVVLDEVHERNLETDFLIIILRDLLQRRPDLRLILMSATMKTEAFSEYFNNCPILEIRGITYPVEIHMLEDVLEMTKFSPTEHGCTSGIEPFLDLIRDKYSTRTVNNIRRWSEDKINFDLVISLLKHIMNEEGEGAILIFLPGWDSIHDLYERLSKDSTFGRKSDFVIPILHSLVSMEEQQEAFNPAPKGMRKIILSSNIAETSVTIEDVVFVIDCGKMKLSTFDGGNKISCLSACWVSRANAKQRSGRAGRVRPGKCYHLFTSYRYSKMPDSHPPEFLRARLENICLAVKCLKLGDIGEFLSKAIDKPPQNIVSASISLLQSLNALDEYENLTSLGSILAQLPLDPRLGKMVLYGAMFSCFDPILTITAVLDYKDPFYVPKKKQRIGDLAKMELANGSQSDHIMFVHAYDEWVKSNSRENFCRENFLSMRTLKMIKKLRLQLANELYNLGYIQLNDPTDPSANKNSENETVLKGIICAALFPNIANVTKVHRSNIICFTKEDGQVSVHPKSIQRISPHFFGNLLVYYNKLKTSKIFLHDTTVINTSLLRMFCGKATCSLEGAIYPVGGSAWEAENSVSKLIFELMENVIGQKVNLNWNKTNTWIHCLMKIIDLIQSLTR